MIRLLFEENPMDISYVSDEINKRMARPYECLKAIKYAKSAIHRNGDTAIDPDAIYCS